MQLPIYQSEEEQRLMVELWSPALADDPEAFVLFAFPWGQKNTPLHKFKGPRKWQREVLRDIKKHIDGNKSKIQMDTLREAVSSGRGIGKSALVSWLVLWMLTTRIGGSVIISANSENQLRSVTWAELTKWSAMAINNHWFEISATKLVPAQWLCELVERDLKKGTRYWAAEGKLWSAENPDSYAGVHNQDGMMLIFDESAAYLTRYGRWALGSSPRTRRTGTGLPLATRAATKVTFLSVSTLNGRSGTPAAWTRARWRTPTSRSTSRSLPNTAKIARRPRSRCTVSSPTRARISSSSPC
jgi:hypothetical protein